jgi:hypothetical protein
MGQRQTICSKKYDLVNLHYLKLEPAFRLEHFLCQAQSVFNIP